ARRVWLVSGAVGRARGARPVRVPPGVVRSAPDRAAAGSRNVASVLEDQPARSAGLAVLVDPAGGDAAGGPLDGAACAGGEPGGSAGPGPPAGGAPPPSSGPLRRPPVRARTRQGLRSADARVRLPRDRPEPARAVPVLPAHRANADAQRQW